MLRVIECLTQDHDLALVALAALICVPAASTGARLLRASQGNGPSQGRIRFAAASTAFGTGSWTTHFISLLAFRPSIPVSFEPRLCILSLSVSVAATATAFAIRSRAIGNPGLVVPCGMILGAGIGAMHLTGMRSLIVPGTL